MKKRRLLACLLCMLLALSLAACGGKKDSDTPAEPNETETQTDAQDETGTPGSGAQDGEQGNGQETESQMPSAPLVVDDMTPEDYAGVVPSQNEIIAMHDDEITGLLSGQPRQVILAAWGEPDMKYDASSDTFDSDQWMLLEMDGIHYVDVHYDYRGQVSDVCVKGTGGKCTADITEFNNGEVWKAGLEKKFWADGPTEDEFEGWCAEQTDANLILSKFQSAGLTRSTIRELMNKPVGHWYSKGYIYQGDVFLVWTDYESEPDKHQFVCVKYDESNFTVPVAVGLYPDEGPGEDDWYISPPFTDMEAIYVNGTYESHENVPAKPQDVEFDEMNTWYKQ